MWNHSIIIASSALQACLSKTAVYTANLVSAKTRRTAAADIAKTSQLVSLSDLLLGFVSDCQVRCVADFFTRYFMTCIKRDRQTAAAADIARCYISLLFGFHQILRIRREIQISIIEVIWLVELLLLICTYKMFWLLFQIHIYIYNLYT